MTIDVATRVAALTPDLKDRLRARLETERALRNAVAWRPYPWQVPPTGLGAHDMWLMLGGRGSGKTEGAAHYVWAHVQSPPCTRRHLGGHRIAVIAPTLGDAIESCVNGPSGLRAIDPRITAHQAAGGTYVEFPNGSQAKVFGANTENDVERLRAGGNRSLLVGTLIRTAYGPVPIETIRAGDFVWTEAGLRPVLWSGSHGAREYLTVTTVAGRELRLTPDHEVWVCQRGWVRADHLTAGCILSTWSGAGTAGNGTAPTGLGQRNGTAAAPPSCCTGPCTSTTTDRYHQAGPSTTPTTTRATTPRATSSPYPPARTGRNTAPSVAAPPGTLLVAANVTRSLRVSARNAVPPPRTGAVPDSAPAHAGGPTRHGQARPAACGHASCAEAISNVPPAAPPSLAHDHVATVSHGSAVMPVWDLTVAGEHDFYASDLLVSNCLVWLEEMAAMRYLAAVLEHSALGLRIGESPHFVASTTPKPRPEVRRLVKSSHTVVTRGTTDAAHHLPAAVRARLEEAYGGTRLGRQELGGELLEDVEGALWTQVLIDAHRVRATDLPDLGRTIVAVDPNAGGDDAAGIVVVALGATRVRDPQGHPADHAYVLADLTLEPPTGSPKWARTAVDAYHRYAADAVVAEVNNGGDMVGNVIRQYDRDIRYRAVTATRGKAVRAEPVVGLYEQGRVHHVGSLPKLEDQLTTWTPAAGWSPDRLDALVWGCTDLMLKRRGGFASAA